MCIRDSHSSVIIRAYDNSYINPEKKEKDVFAINVLKTLFLIKYVLEIDANVDNIVSLMITSIDDDRISLKAQVEDALKMCIRDSSRTVCGKTLIAVRNWWKSITSCSTVLVPVSTMAPISALAA